MTPLSDIAERRRYFDGQRLFADDLNDREAYQRELRWLHNRSLHQPGVGNGYAVTGPLGAREVAVGPGYALDADGREIVLTREVTLPVPPVAGAANSPSGVVRPAFYYLAVWYRGDDFLPEVEYRRAVCGGAGVVRLAEEPVFGWVELKVVGPKSDRYEPVVKEFRDGIDRGTVIVLAQVQVLQCRLQQDVRVDGLAVRRSARPPRLPYIASDTVTPGWGDLEPIPDFNLANAAPNDDAFPLLCPYPKLLKATVSTKTANFVAIPRYLVRIAGPRVVPVTTLAGAKSVVYLEPDIDLQLDPIKTNHVRFSIRVTVLMWVPNPTAWTALSEHQFEPTLTAADPFYKAWQVVWVGVEG